VRLESNPGGQPPAGDGFQVQVARVQAESFGQLTEVEDVLEPAGAVVADGRGEFLAVPAPADADPAYPVLGEHREDDGPDGDPGPMRDSTRDQPVIAGGIEFELDRAVP
jgi:hypothetical protein